jgi:hypothetical protein
MIVARLVSDTLSRNRDNPDFTVSVLPCSITFMHREHWRSDVLVTFHPPMRFSPSVRPQPSSQSVHPFDFSVNLSPTHTCSSPSTGPTSECLPPNSTPNSHAARSTRPHGSSSDPPRPPRGYTPHWALRQKHFLTLTPHTL